MKVIGIALIFLGLFLTIVTSFKFEPGGTDLGINNKVHNWSPLNGMIIMGLGGIIYIGSLKKNNYKF